MCKFVITYSVKVDEKSFYHVEAEGFRAEVTVVEMDDQPKFSNSYIRQTKCAEGEKKLNGWDFKSKMDEQVLNYHKYGVL